MSRPLASVNVGRSFQNLLDTVVDSIARILIFPVILVIRWVVAKLLSGSGRTTVSAGIGSTGSAGPTGAAAYSQDPGSAENYSRGADPGDWPNLDANYW